ncbi:conserved hypothetical protein [Flavobacterium psychrophilum]|uniref:hypothetical protein n=1 Tax=Flavobacterium psychrophilum TaxID=96345 RepID=UPI000B7C15F6|nr:hypothetical protein [Flavobacterium psychrophilum]SNA83219.1 conserved hypothetical protein [Flavobacterium psychrophilum]
MTKKELRRRYKLHQNIKQLFRYSATHKTVYVPHGSHVDNRYIKELQEKFNYQIQFQIA